uniref:dTMP kinase n=1 Tax=Pithovirus LCPAC101 TaxID=2506586 RepID=A0A481Z4L0_9VIRU|nr:MAG: thymidylate kinase [Pithovirus LCPAC101]
MLFIAFEGLDGSGKDTQLNNIVKYLKDNDKYCNIWVTREPTKITESGKKISQLLKDNISKEDATKYFIEDRKEHSNIIKNILKYSHVLTSRYDISTYTYQISQGADFDNLYNLHNYNNDTLIPDITFIFLVSVDIAISRINKRNETKEYFENKDFLTNVKKQFPIITEKLRKKDGRTIIFINGEQDIKSITKDIIAKLEPYLS